MMNREPLDAVFYYEDAVSRFSVGDLREVAAKYLTGKNYIRLVLLPEK